MPLVCGDPRQDRVLDDAPVQKLHDVEVGADYGLVLAETEGLRHGHVGMLQGVQDAVLAVYLMRCLGEQLPWRLFPEHISLLIDGCEEVRWVRLAIAELSTRSIVLLGIGLCATSSFTCFTSNGVLIAGTCWSMYRSSDWIFMGCRIAPAIVEWQSRGNATSWCSCAGRGADRGEAKPRLLWAKTPAAHAAKQAPRRRSRVHQDEMLFHIASTTEHRSPETAVTPVETYM